MASQSLPRKEADNRTSKQYIAIFLDVDGVLNTATSAVLADDLFDNLAALHRHIEEDRQFSCLIVLSSTWRYSPSRLQVVARLRERGVIPVHVTDLPSTADLTGDSLGMYPLDCNHVTRTDEILYWLYCNTLWSDDVDDVVDNKNEEDYVKSLLESKNESMKVTKIKRERDRGRGEGWVHQPDMITGRVERERWMSSTVYNIVAFLCLDDMVLYSRSCFAGKANMKVHYLSLLSYPCTMTVISEGLLNLLLFYTQEHQILTHVKYGFDKVKLEEAKGRLYSLLDEQQFDFTQYCQNVFQACSNENCLHLKKNAEKQDSSFDLSDGEEKGEPSVVGQERRGKTNTKREGRARRKRRGGVIAAIGSSAECSRSVRSG